MTLVFDAAKHLEQAMHVKGPQQHVHARALHLDGDRGEGLIDGIAEDGDLPGLLIGRQRREARNEIVLSETIRINHNQVGAIRLEQLHGLLR
jgi:hypothetical protein